MHLHVLHVRDLKKLSAYRIFANIYDFGRHSFCIESVYSWANSSARNVTIAFSWRADLVALIFVSSFFVPLFSCFCGRRSAAVGAAACMFKRGKVLCNVIVSHLRAVLIHHKNRFFADINVLRIVVLDVRMWIERASASRSRDRS